MISGPREKTISPRPDRGHHSGRHADDATGRQRCSQRDPREGPLRAHNPAHEHGHSRAWDDQRQRTHSDFQQSQVGRVLQLSHLRSDGEGDRHAGNRRDLRVEFRYDHTLGRADARALLLKWIHS